MRAERYLTSLTIQTWPAAAKWRHEIAAAKGARVIDVNNRRDATGHGRAVGRASHPGHGHP